MDFNHICLPVISWDSALRKDEQCYLHVFLKECRYIKKNVIRYIVCDLESSPDDSDDSNDSNKE